MEASIAAVVGHRVRMNSFLNKWLDYLDGQGHGPHTLSSLEPASSDQVDVACA